MYGTTKDPKSQSTPEEKEQSWIYHILPDFKLHYKTTEIKTAWFWHKNSHTDQEQNKEPRINPDHTVNLHLTREPPKSTQRGKDSFFNNWCWENWINTCKAMKLDPYLTQLTKIY